MIFDAHFHYAVCEQRKLPQFDADSYAALSCAHSIEEFEVQKNAPENIHKAFGLHPQSAAWLCVADYADFLSALLQSHQIDTIGEAGFDYFTPEVKAYAARQEEMWNIQLDLAISHGVPLVVHCRKANEKLFEYSGQLKKCVAVLFHSFMGTRTEAQSLLNRGIHGFFSFGKQMMNGNKKVMDCVQNLPIESLLLETDAPFQTLRGKQETLPSEIERIYAAASALRGVPYEHLCEILWRNAADFLGDRLLHRAYSR